jgi:hypothetical protein
MTASAISLERLTGQRIKHLYSMMDRLRMQSHQGFIIETADAHHRTEQARKQQRVLSPSESSGSGIRSRRTVQLHLLDAYSAEFMGQGDGEGLPLL